MKDYDEDTASDTRSLRDRAFLAATRARSQGFAHTAKALDAIVAELSDAPFSKDRTQQN